MLAAATRRLVREASEAKANRLLGITINVSKENLFIWYADLAGPKGTPYEKALFKFEFKFPSDYPLVPPKVKCLTKVFHCNINTMGDVCLDLLKTRWTPLLTAEGILLSLQSLLADPNPDDPLMLSVARLYKSNRAEHDVRAKLFTQRFAM